MNSQNATLLSAELSRYKPATGARKPCVRLTIVSPATDGMTEESPPWHAISRQSHWRKQFHQGPGSSVYRVILGQLLISAR